MPQRFTHVFNSTRISGSNEPFIFANTDSTSSREVKQMQKMECKFK